ncbi:nucleoside triphosphate pyrophosphohydrolase [Colibacter massiliensis]|uniref:nucleoside triphosphate pyrophosphohydrolase n=1 Tax=Colibacter massiliensis TaxID=1852379 RepID=UPI00094EB7C3|nr:nucleoside triphosphate pyrophosphohydrolase [Colibacter massiliensis]
MGRLQIVGLGPGDPGLITMASIVIMKRAARLLLRTAVHPTAAYLNEKGIFYESLDRFYENCASFEDVYTHIVDYVLAAVKEGDVVYAVPGSPAVAERTVTLLEERCRRENIDVEILPGMSFLESLYSKIGLDPVNGLLVADSFDITALQTVPNVPVVITQIYDEHTASDVKLFLTKRYGDGYEALLVHHISLPDEKIEKIKLYELDRHRETDHLTSLVLPSAPPAAEEEAKMPFDITPLTEVMDRLRGEHGCPWDKSQTHKTLRRFLVEEVYEALDAIDNNDNEGICEEFGDILYQVVIHAKIGEEEGLFNAQDIVDHVTKKMIKRHPHVFSEKSLENTGASVINWDRLKQDEGRQQHKYLLDGVTKGLPSLLESYKLQDKAGKVGFGWSSVEGVWDKLSEELAEFKAAVQGGEANHMEEEAGDVLFVLVNLLRYYGIEPECALHRANTKFRRRFAHVEDRVTASGRTWSEFTPDELDNFWSEAKAAERQLTGKRLADNNKM